jgi:ABC-2 type transport system ATP-binding protein
MIRTESLTKYYGQRCAVRDLSITINDREIVGFLGRNGAGKTTTLRMLAGLLAPSSGRVEIDGEVMEATEGDFRWRIGFLPDRPPLYELMTVRGYLEFVARLRGYDPARLPRRLDEVMALTQVTARADDPIRSLSQGFRQRVGIAQAVVHEPALVILDEPITGLDPVQLKEVRGLIRDLKAEHTVLLSSHNLHEVHETCDRLMVIEEGRLVFSGTEQEAASRASAGGALRVTVRGPKDRLQATLDPMVQAGLLTGWKAERSAGDDHTVLAHLGLDAPERLAKAVLDAGLALRSMAPATDQLEDVFTQLTETSA